MAARELCQQVMPQNAANADEYRHDGHMDDIYDPYDPYNTHERPAPLNPDDIPDDNVRRTSSADVSSAPMIGPKRESEIKTHPISGPEPVDATQPLKTSEATTNPEDAAPVVAAPIVASVPTPVRTPSVARARVANEWDPVAASRPIATAAPLASTRSRQRRSGPSLLILLLVALIALAVGAGIGLAFPQVRGVTKASYDRMRDRALASEQGAQQTQQKIASLQTDKTRLEAANKTLTADKAQLQAANTKLQATTAKLQTPDPADTILGQSTSHLFMSAQTLGQVTNTISDVPEISRMNTQLGLTIASILNQREAAAAIANRANRTLAINRIDAAVKATDDLITKETSDLIACKPADKVCKATVATTYQPQLANIATKLESDIAKLAQPVNKTQSAGTTSTTSTTSTTPAR